MIISISNEQNLAHCNNRVWRRLAAFLFARDFFRHGPQWDTVEIVLLDNKGIRTINRRFLDCEETTDVIAFRYATAPWSGDSGFYGEIAINIQRAIEVGPAYRGVEWECALYLAHGCDHLRGEDDATPLQRRRMRRRETHWLKRAMQLGLLPGLLRERKAAGRIVPQDNNQATR